MLSLILATAVLGAEPKPVPGADYYREAVEVLDAAKNERAFAAAVKKLNTKWAKKRIVIEFHIVGRDGELYNLSCEEKHGDWRDKILGPAIPKGIKPQVGGTFIVSGIPTIAGTETTSIGKIHSIKPLPIQLLQSRVGYRDAEN